jgi:hypothetical protein
MATSGNADARKELLALELAKGATVRDACKAVGVPERTAHFWRSEPSFGDRVKELQAELFEVAVARLAAVNGKAADKIGELIDSDDQKTALAASKAALELGRVLRSAGEENERLEAIEKLLLQRGLTK